MIALTMLEWLRRAKTLVSRSRDCPLLRPQKIEAHRSPPAFHNNSAQNWILLTTKTNSDLIEIGFVQSALGDPSGRSPKVLCLVRGAQAHHTTQKLKIDIYAFRWKPILCFVSLSRSYFLYHSPQFSRQLPHTPHSSLSTKKATEEVTGRSTTSRRIAACH